MGDSKALTPYLKGAIRGQLELRCMYTIAKMVFMQRRQFSHVLKRPNLAPLDIVNVSYRGTI